ncbi:MAG: L-serine ammonia-lyase, iron-sulfur-dependent, subunit alpha, partial [Desulfovibrionales bacterium]|nr:L-serine ammonia-lyase, iron-sulfur-dependent, subunit alpha [Desulfovibrionales bacterium]
MDKSQKQYADYINILKEELVPAMGCTEPIAIAYAAAKAREALGALPEKVEVEASDNIIKNVKSVVVPNTGNLRGIEASAVAGIVAGKAEKILEVISSVTQAQRKEIKEFLAHVPVTVSNSDSGIIFDIVVTVSKGEDRVSVRISHYHTNIVSITRNREQVYENSECEDGAVSQLTDRNVLNVEDIVEFARIVDLEEIAPVIQQQIDYNSRIAQEGIRGDWGANVGSVLLETWGDDIKVRAKAMAAAGSDARMSGCELPVVIVSGSGNQGITASVPVIEYARHLKASTEELHRALVVSNLVTIHQKTGIGRLSAYCGAISAGDGAGAGIAWLHGGRFKEIAHTVVNALATV